MQERATTIHIAPSTILFVALTLIASAGLVFLVLNLINVLVTLFLAITLAETIRPLVETLQRRRIHRSVAILLIYLVIIGLLAGSVALIVPPLTQQVVAAAREAPLLVRDLRQMFPFLDQVLFELGLISQLQARVGELAGQAPAILRTAGGALVQGVVGIFNVLSGLVLAGFWIGLTETVNNRIVSRLPVERRVVIRGLARDLSITLGGWLRGQLILMLFVGTISFVGLLVLQVRYPVALAVWAGVTEIVPLIGPWIGGVPAVIIAALVNPVLGVVVFLLYLVIQQIENNFLVPKVMQRAVGLHPFLVLTALLVGGSLLGLAGIIISIPLAAAIQVAIKRLWFPSLLGPAPSMEPIEKVLADLPAERLPGDEGHMAGGR